jgi:orotate phosphoribosyltransferase
MSDLAQKKERLLAIIQRRSVLQGREFRLTSGRSSNFFVDLKKTMFDPEGASLLADLLFSKIKDADVTISEEWKRGAFRSLRR